jgi:hypothetical protein
MTEEKKELVPVIDVNAKQSSRKDWTITVSL